MTCGYSLYEALREAESALSMVLCAVEDKRATNRVDPPTPIEKVIAEPDEFSTSAFVTLIPADTDEYRKTLVIFSDDE